MDPNLRIFGPMLLIFAQPVYFRLEQIDPTLEVILKINLMVAHSLELISEKPGYEFLQGHYSDNLDSRRSLYRIYRHMLVLRIRL